MTNRDKPIISLTRPLAWLDEGETKSEQWLMKHFGFGITAFENTINVLSFAVDELSELVTKSPLKMQELKFPANKERTKQFVAIALLVEALDSLQASRRLLKSGYFSKMFSCIRTMVEALRSSDICRNDETKALDWVDNKEIKKATGIKLHPIVLRMMKSYDYLSQMGTHPMLRSTVVSSLGKPYAFRYYLGIEHPEGEKEIMETIGTLIDSLNKFAGLFLTYVDQEHLVDWGKNPEMKRKKNLILGKP